MRWRTLLELILLGALWGPSFLFIKIAVAEVSPLAMVTARMGIAAILMYIILRVKGLKLPRSAKTWGHLAVLGFFANSFPFILFGYAEIHVDSALAGIINGSTPICAVVLAHFLLPSERITASRLFGVALGLSGFLLLLLPTIFDRKLEGDTWGMLLLGLAAICYGVGMVYGRRYVKNLPPLVAPTGWLIISMTYLIPLYFTFDFHPAAMTFPSRGVIWSVLGLATLGTAAAFALYYRILERDGATYLSMSTYLLPLFATVLGVLFLGEHLHWNAYVAAALILLGMMVVNGTIRLPSLAKRGPPAVSGPVRVTEDSVGKNSHRRCKRLHR